MSSSSHHSSLQVMSPAYFQMYDTLDQDASNLEHSTAALNQIKAQRNSKQNQLQKQQIEQRNLQKIIQEQENRIKLVSAHWFYGTTLLQVSI
jgi:septal ring factor EnvC (AmiA/AmiB activator)